MISLKQHHLVVELVELVLILPGLILELPMLQEQNEQEKQKPSSMSLLLMRDVMVVFSLDENVA